MSNFRETASPPPPQGSFWSDDDGVELIRTDDPDEVDVPPFGRLAGVKSGRWLLVVAAVLFSVGFLPIGEWGGRSMGAALIATLIAACCLAPEPRVRINRRVGTVSIGRKLTGSLSPTIVRVRPQAIRMTVDRDHRPENLDRPDYNNTIFLIHRDGELPLRPYSVYIDSARRVARQLAEFLDVDLYEDCIRPPCSEDGTTDESVSTGRTYVVRTHCNSEDRIDPDPTDARHCARVH